MKRRVSLPLLIAVFGLLWSALPVAAEDEYSERTLKIARDLQCVVCAGQSVAESNSELARQMRGIIEQKVQAGESDAQIKQYFVARYGESILREPPKSGFSLTLWWAPVIAVAFGALIIGLYLHERTGRTSRRVVEPAADEELEAIAREVLGTEGTGGERTART